MVKLKGARFLVIRDGVLAENSTDSANVQGADGYVIIYPAKYPLVYYSNSRKGLQKNQCMEKPIIEIENSKQGMSGFYIGYVAAIVVLITVSGYAIFSRQTKKRKPPKK